MAWLETITRSRIKQASAFLLASALSAGTFLVSCIDDSGSKDESIPAADCPAGVSYFQQAIYEPILSKQCAVCHTTQGMAKNSRLILTPTSDPDHLTKNFDVLRQVALLDENNKPLLLLKPSGEHEKGHTGGILIASDSAGYANLKQFITAVRAQTECEGEASACSGSRAGLRRLRRLTRTEYDHTVQDLLGTTASYGASFTADAVVDGFDNNADALLVAPLLGDQLREAAEALAEEAVSNIGTLVSCNPTDDDEAKACAASFVKDFGARAFRRPLDSAEEERYTQLCELVRSADGFNRCVELVIQAMLQSPHFLYRTELGELTEGNSYRLTSYEVASQLSYFFWGSMPDDELFAAAQANALQTPEEVLAQAKRLLASPKSKPMVEHFSEQWLGVDRVLVKAKTPEAYPDFSDSLRSAMLEETRRFVSHVLLEGSGTLTELFNANYSFVNSELATHYGLNAPTSDWDKVDLPANERKGLLTHSSVLTTWALPGGSSPIHRGLFVRQQLLCQPLPMPPPAVNVQPPPVKETQTTRERFTIHLTDPVCSSCHQLIDPIGFAFEHYDGIGRYRSDENGHAIDDSGEITTTTATNGAIDGVMGLATKIETSQDVQSCFARQWFRYAYGVKESAELSCLMDDVVADFIDKGANFENLVLSLTQSEHFLSRVDDDAPTGTGIGAVSGTAPTEYPGGEGSGTTGSSIEHEPPGTLSISVEEDNWGTGYCRNVVVTNISAAAVTWSITMDTPGTINNVWSAAYEVSGSKTKFSGPEWATQLGPGAEHSFGACAAL